MSSNANSDDSSLPTNEPQAPRKISVESVDQGSRLPPDNAGGEPHGSGMPAGE